jgi:hypothetical protein
MERVEQNGTQTLKLILNKFLKTFLVQNLKVFVEKLRP